MTSLSRELYTTPRTRECVCGEIVREANAFFGRRDPFFLSLDDPWILYVSDVLKVVIIPEPGVRRAKCPHCGRIVY